MAAKKKRARRKTIARKKTTRRRTTARRRRSPSTAGAEQLGFGLDARTIDVRSNEGRHNGEGVTGG